MIGAVLLGIALFTTPAQAFEPLEIIKRLIQINNTKKWVDRVDLNQVIKSETIKGIETAGRRIQEDRFNKKHATK
jgi:hypothetical protein